MEYHARSNFDFQINKSLYDVLFLNTAEAKLTLW